MFKIVADASEHEVGVIGYWPHDWRDEPRLETGWTVLAEYQGRVYATAALLLVMQHAREHSARRWLHAFPKVEHAASNAICRKAGMTLLGEVPFEYPKGTAIVSNDRAVDLQYTIR